MSSGLHYNDSDEEVRHGDRIELTSLILRRRRRGTVVCIPEKTALQLAAQQKQPDDWLIRMDDGTYTGWLYHPEELQPPKRLRLVARAAGPVDEVSNADLERMDREEAGKSSGLGELLGCAALIVIVTAAIAGIRALF